MHHLHFREIETITRIAATRFATMRALKMKAQNKMARYNTENGLKLTFELKKVEKFNSLTFTYDNGVTIEVVRKPDSSVFTAYSRHKKQTIVNLFDGEMPYDDFMSLLNTIAAKMANELL